MGNKEFEISSLAAAPMATRHRLQQIFDRGHSSPVSARGVKFDLDSKNVKNGKTIACYFADEIAGFAMHLVQA